MPGPLAIGAVEGPEGSASSAAGVGYEDLGGTSPALAAEGLAEIQLQGPRPESLKDKKLLAFEIT